MKQLLLIAAGFILGYLLLNQLKGCGTAAPSHTDTLYKTDTLWKHYDTTVKKPLRIKVVIHDTLPPEYIPDPMYDSLKVQYEELAKAYLAKNVYEDSIRIDSFGHVIIRDTVKNNQLGVRTYVSKYSIPIIKDSVFIKEYREAPNKGAIYVGGGFASNKALSNTGHLGILYKTRKDKIVGAYVAVMPGMQIGYGVQTYWKLTFKK